MTRPHVLLTLQLTQGARTLENQCPKPAQDVSGTWDCLFVGVRDNSPQKQGPCPTGLTAKPRETWHCHVARQALYHGHRPAPQTPDSQRPDFLEGSSLSAAQALERTVRKVEKSRNTV